MRNFSRYNALSIRRKYLANSANCSAKGVHISPGRRESVADVAAAPPESVMTDAIFSSVCSIECLWLAGSAAAGAILVMDITAKRVNSATIIIFL